METGNPTRIPSQRERLLDVFAGRRPEHFPWVADLTYWQAGREALGTLPERYQGEDGLMRLHRDTGAGRVFYVRPVVRVARDAALFRCEERREGDTVFRTWHTPEGKISGVYRYAGAGTSLAPIEWPVKTIRDVEVVCSWAEGARYEPSYESFYQSAAEWGEGGYPFIGTARTPLAAFVAEWAGVETFTYLAIDEPAAIERAFIRLREAQDAYFELLAGSPGMVIEIGDNLSATVQASFFRRYSFDYYQQRAGQLHARGKKVGVHIDGTLKGLLHQLPEAGLDFVESVTPAPVGDMNFEEIRAAVGPECLVIGGMPGAMFAAPWDWPTVREHVREAMAVLGREGRFVLGVADQVPPDGDINLVQEISREVDQFAL